MSGSGGNVKSTSVLGSLPSKANVSKQILVKQHLNAHYKKLQCAKASIDTSMPYSFSNNPTTHGYLAQKQNSVTKDLYYNITEDNDANFEMPTKFSDDHTVDCIVKEFLKNNPIFNNIESGNNWTEEGNARENLTPRTKGSSKFSRSVAGSTRLSHATRPGSSSGDVLELHQHKFTKEKPFSPRTMKTNAESKLRQLRCYNPPIKASRLICSSGCATKKKPIRPASAAANLARPNSTRPQRPHTHRSPNFMQTNYSGHVNQFSPVKQQSTASPTRLVNRSSKLGSKSSRDLVKPKPTGLIVSNMKTAADDDDEEEEYVEDEPSRPIGKVNQWLSTLHDSENSIRQSDSVEDSCSSPNFSSDNHVTDRPHGPVNSDSNQRPKDEGELNQSDIGYLNFVEAVTNDVLSRGVFTDRNLNWLIMEHSIRNEYGLTEEQIKQATDQLRRQLKITDESLAPTLHRLSSTSLTVGPTTSAELQLPLRTSLSGEPGTKTGSSAPSFGTTVAAKLVLTSMRPPPAPSRNGPGSRSPTANRLGSMASNRVVNPKKSMSQPGAMINTELDTEQAKSEEDDDAVAASYCRTPSLKAGHGQTSLVVPESSDLLVPSPDKLTSSSWVDGSTQPTESLAQDNSIEDNPPANRAVTDREDTLNDQVTIPNSSVSIHYTEASDFPEASSPDQTRTGTPNSDFLTDGYNSEQVGHRSSFVGSRSPQPMIRKSDSELNDQLVSRPTRVKFAPEPEIFSARPSDPTVSATTLTDLTQLSSGGETQISSQQDAEPDLSSAQAIAEGDSNISLDIAPQKDCSPVTCRTDVHPYRTEV